MYMLLSHVHVTHAFTIYKKNPESQLSRIVKGALFFLLALALAKSFCHQMRYNSSGVILIKKNRWAVPGINHRDFS